MDNVITRKRCNHHKKMGKKTKKQGSLFAASVENRKPPLKEAERLGVC